MALTKDEKKKLQEAAAILTRELTEKKEVAIPTFGKFYVTNTKIRDFDGKRRFVKIVRFKPWEGIKKSVNPPRPKSGNGESTFNVFDL